MGLKYCEGMDPLPRVGAPAGRTPWPARAQEGRGAGPGAV